MNSLISDFTEQTRARGASVAAPEGPPTPGAVPEQPAADEAALMNLLRLLNHVRTTRTISPIERAFVLGARMVFEELTRVCDDLLTIPHAPESSASPASLAPATEESPAPEQPPRPARPRGSRRPTPGGARPPT